MPNKTVKKPNQPSHLKDLILLFAIPIGIAVFAAIAVYAPRLFAKPKYDFIYSVCDNYDCTDAFAVDNSGHISRSTNRNHDTSTVKLRYYSAENDSTRSLTFEEATRYQLNSSSKSPDGYSLIKEKSDSGFLFWGNYDSGWYLKDGAKKKKVELSANDSYFSRDINFLGWIDK